MRGVRAARRNPERSRGYSARTAIAISARRASLSLRLLLLRLILLIPRMLLINRILARRPLHANGDLHVRLVDVIVVAKSLESLGQHLHAQFAVRHAVEIRLAIRIGLDLQSAARLLPILLHRMHHHARIPHRLPVVIPDHQELERSALVLRERRNSYQHHQDRRRHCPSHAAHSKQSVPSCHPGVVRDAEPARATHAPARLRVLSAFCLWTSFPLTNRGTYL